MKSQEYFFLKKNYLKMESERKIEKVKIFELLGTGYGQFRNFE